MGDRKGQYFVKSFLTIVLAVLAFSFFKDQLPSRLFPENAASGGNVVIDSLALAAMAGDSIAVLEPDSLNCDSLGIQLKIVASDNSNGFGHLLGFFQKLYQLETSKQGKVRIAYFSDSMTDGDLIVQDIRKLYQDSYGGKGVGFVGITSLSASSRASITHQYSDNWIIQSFLNTNRPKRAFGIDGQVEFVPQSQSSWLKFADNDAANTHATLLYGSSSNSKAAVSVSIDKDTTIAYQLSTNNIVNALETPAFSKSLKFSFSKADSIPFYGVNFDNGRGVHVDNFSMRGNSGLPLSTLSTDLMNALDKVLGYDLIVLHYGTNVLGYATRDYSWYNNKMANVVNHLKTCFPNASILIVSTADRAVKYDMAMQTDKAVEPLIAAQKKYAEATRSGFINLYMLMGGSGSMAKWVNENPSLANKDYTHFNRRGAEKVGKLIYDEINRGYTQYKRLKQTGDID